MTALAVSVAAGCAGVGAPPPKPPQFSVDTETAAPIGRIIPVYLIVSCSGDCHGRNYFVRRSGVLAIKPGGERVPALSIEEASRRSDCDLGQAMNSLSKGGKTGESSAQSYSPQTYSSSAPPWTGRQQVQGLGILFGLLAGGAAAAVSEGGKAAPANSVRSSPPQGSLEDISLAEEPLAHNSLQGWVYFPRDTYDGMVVAVEVKDASNQTVPVAEIRTGSPAASGERRAEATPAS